MGVAALLADHSAHAMRWIVPITGGQVTGAADGRRGDHQVS